MAKKFINDPQSVVEEMVQGICIAHSDRVSRLAGFHVLLHRHVNSIKQSQVTILSGGGSGHEPAHAGYIGDGMLTGAVLGGVFASPSIASILAAIRASAGPHGVLLVVKNYTGDRLNFGQAALMAKAEGIPVEMIIVADDCALPEGKGITGGRGVAGTVLIHKVVGAAAQAGSTLHEVAQEGRLAAALVKSLGCALTTCTLPGSLPSTRLDEDTIEMGLGIHGEPGMEQRGWARADELTDSLLDVIMERSEVSVGDSVAILVNNLGGTPAMELYVIARRVQLKLTEEGIKCVRLYVGPFMTSLEMQGVSLSLLPVSPLLISRLDSTTSTLAWQSTGIVPLARPAVLDAPEQHESSLALKKSPLDSHHSFDEMVGSIVSVCEALIEAEAQLTEWDSITGDGDCGQTVRRGAEAVLMNCADYPPSVVAIFAGIADDISASMGGTSGALLEIFFRAAEVHLQQPDCTLVGAFIQGVHAIRDIGGAEGGMRTMLDALLPAVASFEVHPDDLAAAVKAAEVGAEATLTMDAKAGRSNYVPKQLLETAPDPGAKAVAIALRALLK